MREIVSAVPEEAIWDHRVWLYPPHDVRQSERISDLKDRCRPSHHRTRHHRGYAGDPVTSGSPRALRVTEGSGFLAAVSNVDLTPMGLIPT